MWLYCVFLFFIVFCIVFHFLTKKYINPYKFYFFMGKKGSGKSTLLTKRALMYMRKGMKVYCTEDVPGTYYLNSDDIGFYEFEEGSAILIDEASLVWDNRDWKSLKKEVIEWYRFQRKRRLVVELYSQSFDIDVKLRSLTDSMYLVRNYFRVFSIARKVEKNITIKKGTADSPSTISEDYEFSSLLAPGSIKITFIPFYTKYFTSFNAPPLKYKVYTQRPVVTFKKENLGHLVLSPLLSLFKIYPEDSQNYEE